MLASLLLLSITLSIDSFAVGIAYGIRNIKIPSNSKLVLFAISFIIILFSVAIGIILIQFIPGWLSRISSGLLLTIMGIWIVYQTFNKNFNYTHIINNPPIYDFDNSKSIDSKEAILLGFAMSCDSFVCGIGFSMTSKYSIIFPFLVALFQFVFLSFGILLGRKIKPISSGSSIFFNRLAGSILVLMGIFKMLFS